MYKKRILPIKWMDTLSRIGDILQYRYKKKVLATTLLVVGNAILDVFSLASIIPLILVLLDTALLQSNEYLRFIYNALGFSDPSHFIIAAVFFLLFIFILKNLFNLYVVNFQSHLVYQVATQLSEREFLRFYNQKYDHFINNHSSSSMRSIVQIPTEFSIYVLMAGISLFSELLVFTFILTTIAIYSFDLFWLLVLLLGVPLIIIYKFQKNRIQSIGRITEKIKPSSLKHLSEGIHSYIEAKLYHKEKYFVKKYIADQKKLNQNFSRFFTFSFLPARIIEVIAVGSIVILVLYSLHVSKSTEDIILLLTLFAAAAYRIIPALNKISVALLNIKSYRFTVDLLHSSDSAESAALRNATLHIRNKIELKNISFSYDSKSTFKLDNVNMQMKIGEIIGIFGKSGSGKTTLINILLRFLNEQTGQICIDERPLTGAETASWRDLMGYVKQDPFLLDDTIRKNIAFAEFNHNIDTAKLNKSIKQAGLHDLVSKLPNGVETQIGEKGYRLSGGQKQRLAIARALYRESQILIFDEATSEIDSQTEQEILNAIQDISSLNRIMIVIAHRPSILRVCNRIYEIKNGKISAPITHDNIQGKRKSPVQLSA